MHLNGGNDFLTAPATDRAPPDRRTVRHSAHEQAGGSAHVSVGGWPVRDICRPSRPPGNPDTECRSSPRRAGGEHERPGHVDALRQPHVGKASVIAMLARSSVTRTSHDAGRNSRPTLSNVYFTICFWLGSTHSVTRDTFVHEPLHFFAVRVVRAICGRRPGSPALPRASRDRRKRAWSGSTRCAAPCARRSSRGRPARN